MPARADLPLLINQQPELDRVCAVLSDCDQVVVDTEFVRTKTYAPHLGLLQLKAGDTIACVDPLAEFDLRQFWKLLFDPGRLCILHSAKQDMEVLWFEQQQIIGNLLDTQVCAGLLGYPAQIGYAGLVMELLGVELDKTQTRTDWSRRPLTKEQIKYAAEDVEYLPELKKQLTGRLIELGRMDWAIEDSNQLCDVALYQPAPARAWQRIKSVPFLPPEEQARIRALAAWREDRAVQADKPRQWIISDKALLQIAADNPTVESELRGIDDLPPPVARKQGRNLITILANTNDALASGELDFRLHIIDRSTENALSKKLMKLVRAKAEELGIAAEVLASKKDVSALIRGSEIPKLSNGWRKAVIGEELAAAL
jgi:ribonuclease D